MSSSSSAHLPAAEIGRAHLLALARLPGMGPARLRAVCAHADPPTAWASIVAGVEPLALGLRPVDRTAVGRWTVAARDLDVAQLWRCHTAAGAVVVGPGDAGWPTEFDSDPEPPMLFFASAPLRRAAVAVAIVGTRRCSAYGRSVAAELGRALADAGVTVVSGLASGVDSAAQWAALDAEAAPVVGVVATGIDVVYPATNRPLFHRLRTDGTIVSEWPLGTPAERWRFPARNRIVAALSDLVVVVESPERGGSMHTVDAAAQRDIPVMAVPGPIRNPMSAGTNRLIAEGCAPVCDPSDVLLALGLGRATSGRPPEPADPADRRLLDAMGWEPVSVDELTVRLGWGLVDVSARLVALQAAGHVADDAGWWQRC